MTANTEFVNFTVPFEERSGSHLLFGDAEDLKLGIGLSVADVLLGILFGLVSDHVDLLALAVFNNVSGNGSVNGRSTNNKAVFSANGENLFEGIGRT